MATKVKGDAIKEGSIPLSALSSEVKNKIENAGGGADWNAQEGEAGYIENKPFGDTLNTPITEKYDFEFVSEEGDAPVVYVYKTQLESSKLYIKYPYYCGYDDDTQFGYSVVKLDAKNELYVTTGNSDFHIKAKIHVIPSHNEMEDDVYELYIEAYNYENLKSLYVFEDRYTEILKPIPSVYLPNTIIKTTPQTLSDTDKNQALANLGIDPIVWKYICNPYKLNILSNGTIPKDLLSIIVGDEGLLLPITTKVICPIGGDEYYYIAFCAYSELLVRTIDYDYSVNIDLITGEYTSTEQ